MMKLNKFAFMSAIALGAVGFTACSSDDDITSGQPNPTFDGEAVKTQFAINIPNAGRAGSRLTEGIVQGAGTIEQFRGISNIRLVPFKNVTGDPSPSVSGSTSIAGVTPISLGAIASTGSLQTPDSKNYHYKVYYDVPVDVDVNYFLFYGEATEEDLSTYADNGSTRPSFDVSGWPATGTLANINFDLRSRLDNKAATVTSEQNILAAMLNDIASATDVTNAWNNEIQAGDLYPYYTAFTGLKAGSANSIMAAIADLYASMKTASLATDKADLKNAICTKIEKYFVPGTASSTTAYVSYPNFTYKTEQVDFGGSIGNVKMPASFPADCNLPDGSMKLQFTSNSFSYVTGNSVIGGADDGFQTIAYANYAYPASLYYTTATPIKCEDAAKTDGNGVYTNATSYDSWEALVNGVYNSSDNSKVKSSTQSIALVNEVNYAVASLNVFARFNDGAINDNGSLAGVTEGEKAVTIPAEGFPLTGILIGDQKRVGYDFKPINGDTGATTWTIYDSSHDDAAIKQSSSLPATPTAYTLALETAGASEEKVNFALELVNESGQEFKGVDGIVPAGGKFYLVGKLEATTDNPRVFEQDHKTIANVTINSLKNAYNCIPDLRSPKLELGLSVNLEWQQGLVDEVVIQ